MKEERNIITIDEYGRLNMPTDTAAIWMTEAGACRNVRCHRRCGTYGYQSHLQRKRPTRLRSLRVYPSGQRQQCGRV